MRRTQMLCCFDGVALLTGGHELLNVLHHTPPDIQVGDQSTRAPYAWVRYVVGHLHDGGLHLGGNQDPRVLGGGVHQHDVVVDHVLLHVETAAGPQLLNIRTTSLSVTQLLTR